MCPDRLPSLSDDGPGSTELLENVRQLLRLKPKTTLVVLGAVIVAYVALSIRMVWPPGLPGDLVRSRSRLSHERLWACEALARHQAEPQRTTAAGALLRLLRDPDSHVRGEAADGLGKLRCREAVSGLITLLDDGTDAVVYAAATALASLGDERGTAAVQRTAVAGSRTGQRACAAQALGYWKRQPSVDTLRRILQDEPEAYVRWAAVMGLARIGTPEALDAIRLVERSLDVDGGAAREALYGERDRRVNRP